jgi:hypothetical protein
MPESAKQAVESESSGELPGVLPVAASKLLGVSLNDINRYIRSGRLRLDASGRFVTQESFDALQDLIRSN